MATLSADSPRPELVRLVGEDIWRTVKAACETLSRSTADALRLARAAKTFWRHDVLIVALGARGHLVYLAGGETPHLVIDGVAATFGEATAFHRGIVTLADIEQLGALSSHALIGPSRKSGHSDMPNRNSALAQRTC